MRDWMKAQKGAFTACRLCDALGVNGSDDRDAVRRDLHDFLKRGEIERAPDQRIRRQNPGRYRYVHTWRKGAKDTPLKAKILKAMYVSGSFAVTDVQRLSGAPRRSFIDKLVRRLETEGRLKKVGRRPCAHGAGAEQIYHIADRDRFRIEVMR